MSESTEFVFKIEPLPLEEACQKFGLDMWVQYRGCHVLGGKESTFNSNITGAGFKVSPWLSADKNHVTGILVKINNPICLIGNNAFIENMIYESARLALLFLKMALKTMGVKQEYRKLLSVKNSYIRKFDLTFLFNFKSIDEAINKRNELEDRIKSIFHSLNHKYRQTFGEGADKTIYLNYPNHPSMRAYIKWHDISRASKEDVLDVNNYLSLDVKNRIYAFSRSMLRIELTIRDSFLKKKYPEMMDVISWRDKTKSDEIIKDIFYRFREMLMVDVNFRHNKHRPKDFEKLDKKIQIFLDVYYKGDKQSILKEMTKSQRYELKKKILEKSRIDISIPWELHRNLLNMSWINMPSPIEFPFSCRDLYQYVFCRDNMSIFLGKIKSFGVTNAFEQKSNNDLDSEGLKDKPYQGFGNLKIPDLGNED